ncbi:MAG: helix-turn-helix domain-containing protein [Lachnospiraceae bacterium]
MQHATELLRQNNPPKIYEIATAVGIENTATFIRQFKKYTGITPSQYQKNAKTKELP